MKETIVAELKRIEEEHNVRILYACESGSRAWGFPSKDSDYDVRFIYIHPIEWYLSISDKRDVIELPINDVLDINGWDIRKALKLFRKSNPPMLEWLHSPIVYLEQFSTIQKIKELIPFAFSQESCLYHYLSMAKGNYGEHLQGESVRIKKYFYALRPILACMWIEQHQSVPPMDFEELLESMLSDGILRSEIYTLLDRKKAGEELDYEPKVSAINEFIETQIQYFINYSATVGKGVQQDDLVFDQVFRVALEEVWKKKYFG